MEACKISNMYTLSETIAAGLLKEQSTPGRYCRKSMILFWSWAKAFLRTNLKKRRGYLDCKICNGCSHSLLKRPVNRG